MGDEMNRVRSALVAINICLAGGYTAAQTVPVTHHHTTKVNVIDGAVHPDRIPDASAYRLFFLALSTAPNSSYDDKLRQASHIGKIGLNDQDKQNLISRLAIFSAQYRTFTESWNAAAMTALKNGQPFNATEFLKQRNALVQSTRNSLAVALSSNGLARLQQHITAEKSRMKVDAEEAQ
jgi:hypothetical protein